ARGIESGDLVMMYNERVPNFKDTILGVFSNDLQFDEALKNGHIELGKAAVTAVALVTPAIKKGVTFSNFLNTVQPTNVLQGAITDTITGNYNFKLGIAKIKKLGESKYKHTFNSMTFVPRTLTA
ncbi:hypothetical protein MNBD_GAMMA19-2279, partial [hydrothermal vent metagenome]